MIYLPMPAQCPFCGKTFDRLRGESSWVEYKISGLCQECQDEVFGGLEQC